jgi:hypothetical protein
MQIFADSGWVRPSKSEFREFRVFRGCFQNDHETHEIHEKKYGENGQELSFHRPLAESVSGLHLAVRRIVRWRTRGWRCDTNARTTRVRVARRAGFGTAGKKNGELFASGELHLTHARRIITGGTAA